MSKWNSKVVLGRSGLEVSRLALGSSFGLEAADIEHAFERGINFFYWGSYRRPSFGRGLSQLAPQHREKMVVVVQSYTRVAGLMERSLDSALRRLKMDYTDLLLLGWWNKQPPERIVEAALKLLEKGKARHIMVSCHHRPNFEHLIREPAFGAVMVRYNAAHIGAEKEVFPFLGEVPPGVVGYTATRWGDLLAAKLMPEGEPTPTATDCYRFVLSNPHVDVSMSGPANRRHLDEAILALEKGPLDEDGMAWMRRVGDTVHRVKHGSFGQRALGLIERMMGSDDTRHTR